MRGRQNYDRQEVGKRLQSRRKQLGWSRKFVADKVGLVEKCYADIERGSSGMSIETLLAVTRLYGFTMDELIFGNKDNDSKISRKEIFWRNLEALPTEAQDYCLQMLLLFVKGIGSGGLANKQPADVERE